MIVCVLLERFELAVAAGGRAGLLGEPAALAPEPGRELFVGEVSQAAEAFGIHAGMRMGEALSRCPRLALVPPDPMGVAEAWERALTRLESLGAAVESLRPGEACFDARGLRAAARRPGRADALPRATSPRRGPSACAGCCPARGSGRGRRASARSSPPHGARVRRPGRIAGAGDSLRTGRAAAPPRGDGGARRAARAARDRDARRARRAAAQRRRRPLRAASACSPTSSPAGTTRRCTRAGPGELLRERLELPESGSGEQLGRALGMLIDRLLARRERRGRTLRAVVLSARLVEGGTWRERVVFREALAERRADAARRSAGAWRCCPRRPTRWSSWSSASARPIPRPARCSTTARRATTSACARRSARRAPSPDPMPRCASSRSIPTRACPSGASC